MPDLPAAPHDSDFLARGRLALGQSELAGAALPIGDEALEVGDADGLALLAQNAA